jgi:hypothetical protein
MALTPSFGSDDSLMMELRVALATSHTVNHQRTVYSTPGKNWPGRIEKSRSTHTSPAHDSRRRAWSGTLPTQPLYNNIYGMSHPNVHRRVSTHQRSQRPLSWHPSSNQMSTYTSSPMTIDLHPLQPQYPELSPHVISSTHSAYDLPDLYMQAGPLSNCSTSSAGLPNTSPVWQMTPTQTYMLNHQQQSCQLQSDINLWQDPISNQVLQEPSKPMAHQYPNILTNIHVNSAATMVEDEVEEEEDGEILVGVGLYDDPPGAGRQAPSLKLAETWSPPPSSDGSSDEAEVDDIADDTNEDSAKLQDQSFQNILPQNMQQTADTELTTTILRRNEDTSMKELWQNRINQSPMHGLSLGTGWMHATSWQNCINRRTTLSQ